MTYDSNTALALHASRSKNLGDLLFVTILYTFESTFKSIGYTSLHELLILTMRVTKELSLLDDFPHNRSIAAASHSGLVSLDLLQWLGNSTGHFVQCYESYKCALS